MDFLDYLAETLANTDDDEIEIGFSKESTLDNIIEREE